MFGNQDGGEGADQRDTCKKEERLTQVTQELFLHQDRESRLTLSAHVIHDLPVDPEKSLSYPLTKPVLVCKLIAHSWRYKHVQYRIVKKKKRTLSFKCVEAFPYF